MADYKFKVGDEAVVLSDAFWESYLRFPKGTKVIVTGRLLNSVCFAKSQGGEEHVMRDDELKLIESETHTKLTPKVGDKFRVVKELKGYLSSKGGYCTVGDTATIETIYVDKFTTTEGDHFYSLDCLTTEYLEPVEEELKGCNTFTVSKEVKKAFIKVPDCWYMGYPVHVLDSPTIKQPITTKIMNRIKTALLSKADKTLIKAGYLDSNLDLTCEGKEALQFIQFTANKAELVKMAEEDIKESEEN